MLGALPCVPTHHECGVRKQELHRLCRVVGPQQPSRVVEVKMRQHDAVDVFVGEAGFLQIVEQDVPLFLNAEAVAHLRRKECADSGLEPGCAGRHLRSATPDMRAECG